jgi:hypothetical protein
MVKVDQYARVRRAHRDGLGIRALAKLFHHSRRKIREILAMPEPKPYIAWCIGGRPQPDDRPARPP